MARYAESDGQESDRDRPHAYHYRDFVIRAFNDDMPYDQFVRWQIAGDEIEPNNDSAVAATGFLTAGPSMKLKDTFLERERLFNRYNELDDMISTLGTGLLALTVGCARCHDHKYDAFSSREYYQLLSVFHSGDRINGKLPSGEHGFFFHDFDADVRTTWLFRRSDFYDREIEVKLGFPAILSAGPGADQFWADAKESVDHPKSTLQRRALADWITDVEQGGGALLARVIVNRIWQHHIGSGLVQADEAAVAATDAAERYRWKQYASDMKVAVEAWESANVQRVLTLLRRHEPQPGQQDLRGFEWYYLWRLCRPSETTRTFALTAPSWLAFSPDGKSLAATGRGMLRLWDLETDRVIATLDVHQSLAPGLAYSPDGQILATAGWDGKLKLWRLDEREEPLVLNDNQPEIAASYSFYDLAFSPDDRLLATDGAEHEVLLWELDERKVVQRLQGHTSRVRYLAFSPDGRLASGSGDGKVWLWDLETGKGMALSGHEPGVTCVTFSPDGATVVSGGEDNQIKIWDVATGGLKAILKGHANTVSALDCSVDNKTLASAGRDGTVKLWNIHTLEELATIRGHGGSVIDVAFCPDGRTVASAGLDGNVRLWDVVAATRKEAIEGLHAECSPGGALMTWNHDGVLKIWDWTTGQLKAELTHPSGGCVGRSPDGKRLALGHRDGGVELRVVATSETRVLPERHDGPVGSVRFSPDGTYLASFTRGGKLRLWDLNSSTSLAEIEFFSLSLPAFSPDWSTIATCSRAPHAEVYAIKLWDFTGKELVAIKQQDPIFSLAFSDDGAKLAAGTWNGEIQIWDLRTREQVLPPSRDTRASSIP